MQYIIYAIPLLFIGIGLIISAKPKKKSDRLLEYMKKNEDGEIRKLSFVEKVSLALIKADLPWRGKEFISINVLIMIIIIIVFSLITKLIVVGIMFSILWLIAPFVGVNIATGRRKAKIEKQLIPALLLIKNALKAGYTFMQSLALVAKEIEDPLGSEFDRIVKENSLGGDFAQSIEDMSRRLESDELTLLCKAVLINTKVGGKMTDIIDNILRTISDRVKLKGEIRTLTSQGKLSGIIISCLPIFLFFMMLLLNRPYMLPLVTTTWGWIVIGVCCFNIALAGFVIYKMINKKLI